jgi:hypothetical protein
MILDAHRDAMDRMVAILLEKETVGPEEVAQIFGDVPKWEHDPEGGLRIPESRGDGEDSAGEAAAVAVEPESAASPSAPRKPRIIGVPRMRPADAPGSG